MVTTHAYVVIVRIIVASLHQHQHDNGISRTRATKLARKDLEDSVAVATTLDDYSNDLVVSATNTTAQCGSGEQITG